MSMKIKGPWSEGEIAGFLSEAKYPMRLACSGGDGYPRVVSVWFMFLQGDLFCVSHSSSQLVALLGVNNRVGFEIAPNEPPYFGVRGQGDAVMTNAGAAQMLERLLQRYLDDLDSPLAQWLLSRREEETLITITPRRLFSWDYRERMG